ncbi:uncharacterized protein LOC124353384 [Homalodisca vitripennis]|uniref:uncharacterized protein LOC124353384 n=1 Tax=Homalodisca vitripennis TaxID=197043 RepID=UPI001EEA30B6|nr:uncharacterized protein LOC124353384 [Homalodisca vitripennis]
MDETGSSSRLTYLLCCLKTKCLPNEEIILMDSDKEDESSVDTSGVTTGVSKVIVNEPVRGQRSDHETNNKTINMPLPGNMAIRPIGKRFLSHVFSRQPMSEQSIVSNCTVTGDHEHQIQSHDKSRNVDLGISKNGGVHVSNRRRVQWLEEVRVVHVQYREDGGSEICGVSREKLRDPCSTYVPYRASSHERLHPDTKYFCAK